MSTFNPRSTTETDEKTPSMCDVAYMVCVAAALDKQMEALENDKLSQPDPRYLSACEYTHTEDARES